MNDLVAFLAKLVPGAPIALGDAALVPLLALAPLGRIAVEMLEDALQRGHTRVTEIGRDGVVNEVLVEHHGSEALLLVDGEQIVGAKQNRIVNASFVVPPGEATPIPVSCVERGRWAFDRPDFEASGTTLSPVMRARKLARVTTSLASTSTYDADQSAVWRDVDELLETTQTRSRTSAYEDVVRAERARIERRLDDLAPVQDQVGLSVVRDDRVELLEVFGTPELFAKAWRKIARGVLVDVREGEPPRDAQTRVRLAIARLARLPLARRPSPGRGESLHGRAESSTACAIVDQGRVVHLVAAA